MAGGKRKKDGKPAQLNLFGEEVMAEIKRVKTSPEDPITADPPAVTDPLLPADIPATNELMEDQLIPSEQPEEKKAPVKTKHKKDQEARLAALWKARGKK